MSNLILGDEWVVDINCDLYEAGVDECGTPYSAECYSIHLRHISGKQLAHEVIFYGCKTFRSEEGFDLFTDYRKEAKEDVERLYDKVIDAGKVDLAYWVEIEPSYGSDYYCEKYGF